MTNFFISAPVIDLVQTDWRDEPFCADKEIYTVDVNNDNTCVTNMCVKMSNLLHTT